MPGRTFFWCGRRRGEGHIVGEIGTVELRTGGRTTALMQYETSVAFEPVEVPAVRGKVISGYGMHCTVCGREYEWYPSLESLRRLMSRYEVSNG